MNASGLDECFGVVPFNSFGTLCSAAIGSTMLKLVAFLVDVSGKARTQNTQTHIHIVALAASPNFIDTYRHTSFISMNDDDMSQIHEDSTEQ